MLQNYIGKKAFKIGINEYLQTFSYKNAETADLYEHLSTSSGKEVGKIMNGWECWKSTKKLFPKKFKKNLFFSAERQINQVFHSSLLKFYHGRMINYDFSSNNKNLVKNSRNKRFGKFLLLTKVQQGTSPMSLYYGPLTLRRP